MSTLTAPKINITFAELGISAIARGTKGVVALIVRDAADVSPMSLTQADQTPTTLGKENQEYIKRAFLGYVNPPKKVIVYTAPEEDDLTDALAYMATQDFDYLAGPADCASSDAAAIASWVMSQRKSSGAKYKAVLPKHSADKYPIVNFAAESLTVGSVVYSAAEYCSRIAGLLAGTPMKISATYAPLPEVTDVNRLTETERDAAVGRGELLAYWDGRKVKLCRAVNSMTTTSDGLGDSFKKIKIVEIMDLIRTDITATAEDDYIGKYDNDYDNKLLLITAIRGYLRELAVGKLIRHDFTVEIDLPAQTAYLTGIGVDTSEMSDQEIKEADTGTHVFIRISLKILDAVEDITIPITI